ncbi:MAG: hypothetical protein LCH39_01650 [Proteobacteria bacterium]|nr:hypothetical protein [Pseudomonadota bacterium]
MDWTDLAKILSPLAPLLGGVLGGPAGAAAGSVVGGIVGKALGVEPEPGAIADAIKADPEGAREKLAQADADHGASVIEMEARMLDTINATMREEMKSEHWLAWCWRPLFGITFNLVWTIHGLLIGWCMWQRDFSVIARIPDLTVFYGVAGAAVGIYAWRRTDEKKLGIAGPVISIANAATTIAKAVKK